MIKLLHVLPSLIIGGAESLVVEIMKKINRKIFDVALCVLFPPYNTILEDELMKMKITAFYLGKHRGVDLRMPARIDSTLKIFRPDIIHTHNYVMRYTLVPTLRNRIPIRIHTVHNIAQREVDNAGKLVHWIAFNFFNYVPVSISASVAASVNEVYGISSPLIYNGIPMERFKKHESIRKEKESGTLFINVGNFRPQKNHRLLIDAFTGAVKIRKDIKLLLVGDGPLRPDIERLVKERNLESKIFFLGHRNDVPELLRKSDVFVSSSEWEGFGLSLVEAMAVGKPVIATAVDGVPELVKDKVNGLLVPNKDINALTSAISVLAANHKLIKRMGREGRIRALRHFDIISTTTQYEELYLKLFTKFSDCSKS